MTGIAEKSINQWVCCPRQAPTCLVSSGILDSIGNTPLIRINSASDATGCDIYGKCEFMNPGASVKDRAALYIIRDAEARGELKALLFFGTFLLLAAAGTVLIDLRKAPLGEV